ncbi:hypothetical protein IWQ56_003247 [Coemansia nantahalensis]|uniref:Uncharacterized protein n=1 Tax=Coemansia nantahalensis TaxID=2789366 RepID=A0ACC1JXP5_9FUNG|nr:hypothetical protein IWQ56_003247 [Coemansia nantahalensis]KAJ2769101.1 hypothetical protein IWQ57_003251 [Coemansia nantahalensis]
MFYVQTTILPASPCIVLRGPPSLAPSEVLTGRVLFRLGHCLKVKTATITFQQAGGSRHRLSLSPGGSPVQLREELFAAADQSADYVVWKANHGAKHQPLYEFPFSLVVPGHLHASVNTSLGAVCYELRVTVQTAGFGINTWSESLRVPVFRVPDEGALQRSLVSDSLRTQADWLGAVVLQLLSDATAVADDTKMRARIVVRPLQKGLRLADIGLRLAEAVCFKQQVDRFGDPRTHDRVVCQVHRAACHIAPSGLSALPLTRECSFDMELHVPRAFGGIQYSMDTHDLRIGHDLVLTATVIDENQCPHHLRISSPVQVVPSLALDSAFTELPAYQQSGLDRLLLANACPLPGYSPSHPPLPPPPRYQHANA